MLDVITYRYSGHSSSDASSYRGRDEIALWREHDSIRGFGEYLRANGYAEMAGARSAAAISDRADRKDQSRWRST